MALAVVPQMRFGVHGSLLSTSRMWRGAVVFLTQCRAAVTPRVDQDEVLVCELMATSEALERERRKDHWGKSL